MAAWEEPLKAFHGKVDFEEAYKWNRTKVVGFLKEVYKSPSEYGVPLGDREDVLKATDRIIKACNPEVKHITTIYPKVEGKKPSTNQADLVPEFPEFKWNGIVVSFYGIFDTLGYVLSHLGRAPISATSYNYYLPLLILYIKWNYVLAGGALKCPYPNFITFEDLEPSTNGEEPEGVQLTVADGRVALGCGGPKQDSNKDKIRLQRWEWLKEKGEPVGIIAGDYLDPNNSPEREESKKNSKGGTEQGTFHGSCGETQPLLIKSLHYLGNQEKMKEVKGFCLLRPRKAADYPAEYLVEPFLSKYKQPCLNCQRIMKLLGLDRNNFGFTAHFPQHEEPEDSVHSHC